MLPHKVTPLVLIVTTFIGLGLVYDSATPIFEAIDEHHHFAFVRYLASSHSLPVQDPRNLQLWRQEGSQAPLYYVVGALLTFWIDTSDFDERLKPNPHGMIGIPLSATNDNRNLFVHTAAESFPYRQTTLAVHLLRWLSLLMGAGTVSGAYYIAMQVTGKPGVAILTAALIAFNPMFLYISTSVNNDNAATLLATLTLLLTIRAWQRGLNWQTLVILGTVTGLAMLSKTNAIGLLGVVGLAVLGVVWREAQTQNVKVSIRNILLRIIISEGIVSIPILLIAGWWYARNFFLYGDLTGLNSLLDIMGRRSTHPPLLRLLQSEAQGLWLSFWGVFGWFNILADGWVYTLINSLSVCSMVGFSWHLLASGWSRRGYYIRGLIWPALWLMIVLAEWLRYTTEIEGAQGRLFFPAISALCLMLAIGLTALMPKAAMRPATALLSGVLAVMALWIAVMDIRAAYTPSAFLNEVPASAAITPIQFGDSLALVGMENHNRAVRPGDVVNLLLCWKALTSTNQDYSIFVHILDDADLTVAQRDTYPGLGLHPTSQLHPGEIVCDAYPMTIDPAAIAPGQTKIRVGVYDFASGQRLSAAIQGHPVTDAPSVGEVTLRATEQGRVPNSLAYMFDTYFSLIGYQVDTVLVQPGDSFTLTLYWQVQQPSPINYSIFTHVLGNHDAIWGQVDRQQPTTRWTQNEIIVDPYSIQLKPETPPAVYDIEIGVYAPSDNFKRLDIWDANGQYVGNRLLLRKIRVLPN